MRAKVAKVLNRISSKQEKGFNKKIKRLWQDTPRPMRNKFIAELVEASNAEEKIDAE